MSLEQINTGRPGDPYLSLEDLREFEQILFLQFPEIVRRSA